MLDLGFAADGVAGYLACIAFVFDGYCPPPLKLQVEEGIVLEVDISFLSLLKSSCCVHHHLHSPKSDEYFSSLNLALNVTVN